MSETNEIELLTEFKMHLVAFLDELIITLPGESDLVILRIFIKDQVPIITIMDNFRKKLLHVEKLVVEKNEKFFIGNDDLFASLDSKKVNHFKNIWLNKDLTQEDKDVVWQWFKLFISLAKKYDKLKSRQV